MTVTVSQVRERLDAVRGRISAAGGGADVEILAVTKGFDADVITVAVEAGCMSIGENYAQELIAKTDTIASFPELRVHFIGQLQTNKVRQLSGLVTLYESVDRTRLVNEIARRHPGASVLLQVDTSALTDSPNPGKGGCPLADLDALVEHARGAGLVLRGLMAVGPTTGGPDAARDGFLAVRAAVDRHGLEICSMGMSADLEVAVECGTTEVRVGTALFGSRPVPIAGDLER